MTGSFGVATLWTISDATVEDLIRAADRALYRAKATGRNRVAPAGEWDFLARGEDTGSAAADPVADALFRAAELLDADLGPGDRGTAMGRWAGLLADHLHLDSATHRRCVLGARLHDIGKLAVPHSMLAKPGPLTDAEWTLMRTHPEHGEALVALAPSVADLGPVIRSHHERVDGTGYPDRLAGVAIPVEARIVAVCDAWAAMRTLRNHADARSIPEARREMTAGAGTQFDPEVVEMFLRLQQTQDVGTLPGASATTTTASPAGQE